MVSLFILIVVVGVFLIEVLLVGCPVYIWRVEPGSLADRSGLKSGDEIFQANGISFGGISHAEALKVCVHTSV